MRSLENIFPTYGVQRRLRSDNFRKAAILGSNNWSHIISYIPIPVKTSDGVARVKKIQPEGSVLCE